MLSKAFTSDTKRRLPNTGCPRITIVFMPKSTTSSKANASTEWKATTSRITVMPQDKDQDPTTARLIIIVEDAGSTIKDPVPKNTKSPLQKVKAKAKEKDAEKVEAKEKVVAKAAAKAKAKAIRAKAKAKKEKEKAKEKERKATPKAKVKVKANGTIRETGITNPIGMAKEMEIHGPEPAAEILPRVT